MKFAKSLSNYCSKTPTHPLGPGEGFLRLASTLSSSLVFLMASTQQLKLPRKHCFLQLTMNSPPSLMPSPPEPFPHSPLQLIICRSVFGSNARQLAKDLRSVDSEAGEQDELLPGGAQQAGVVLDGELTEEGQLLDPRDLAEEEFVGKATQQCKQLHLRHFVPGAHGSRRRVSARSRQTTYHTIMFGVRPLTHLL